MAHRGFFVTAIFVLLATSVLLNSLDHFQLMISSICSGSRLTPSVQPRSSTNAA